MKQIISIIWLVGLSMFLDRVFSCGGVSTCWVGAAISVGSSLLGGLLGAKSKRDSLNAQRNAIRDMMRDNENDYYAGKGFSADYLDRVNRATAAFRKANQRAEGVNSVIGGTTDSLAAQKEANASVLSDQISSAAAAEDARKRQEKAQYENRKYALKNQLAGLEAQEDNSEAIGAATAAIGQAAGTLAEGQALSKAADATRSANNIAKEQNIIAENNSMSQSLQEEYWKNNGKI